MADRFTDALKLVRQSPIQEGKTRTMLLEIVYRMSFENISVNDAMMTLQLFFEDYERQRRPKAAAYCIMEAQRLLLAKKNPFYRALYPTIDFSGGIEKELTSFFLRKRDLYSRLKDRYIIRWSWLASLIALVLLAVLSLLLHFNFFFSFLVSLLFWIGLQIYGTRILATNYAQSMLARYYPALDRIHQQLVKSWRIRHARLIWLIIKQNLGVIIPKRDGTKKFDSLSL